MIGIVILAFLAVALVGLYIWLVGTFYFLVAANPKKLSLIVYVSYTLFLIAVLYGGVELELDELRGLVNVAVALVVLVTGLMLFKRRSVFTGAIDESDDSDLSELDRDPG